MKRLNVLLALLVCSWSQMVGAQVNDSWVNFTPPDEQFSIQMPNAPQVMLQKNSVEQLGVDARVYTTTSDGVEFTVWSLVNEGQVSSRWEDAYLDACAELVWESLLKPFRDQISQSLAFESRMSYEREFKSNKVPVGREYRITLGNRPGLTRFYLSEQHIYVLTVLNADGSSSAAQRFLNSFDIKKPEVSTGASIPADPVVAPSAASPGAGLGERIGPGRGGSGKEEDRHGTGGQLSPKAVGSIDYDRIFTPREVTEKARITSKPEPNYTESARKYSVQGTVILRAVLSKSGQVVNIIVVQGVPHGLSERAVAAARNLRFTPATKDGQPVSMHIQFEYSFNLF